MNRKKPAAPIKNVLAQLFARHNWAGRLGLHQLFAFWEEAVGEDIARQARPACIKGDVLWVEVTDSIWMQQLHLQKTVLLDTLNARLAGDGLADIRFRLSRGSWKTVAEKPPERPTKAKKKKADPEKKRRFMTLVKGLPDSEVRRSIIRMWEKGEARKFDDSEDSG